MPRLSTHQPTLGSYILPDGWSSGVYLQRETWFKADFRLPLLIGGPITDIAVKVEVIGRSIRRLNGLNTVRVKITAVGDDTPDEVLKGYMEVTDSNRKEEPIHDMTNYFESLYS